ncbi:MAG: carboxypeptidase regulatory-like domain-containing protein [Cyclobacteriaceae bacterium]
MQKFNKSLLTLIYAFLLITLMFLISCKNDDNDEEDDEPIAQEQVIDQVVVPASTNVFSTQQTNTSVKNFDSNGTITMRLNDDTQDLETGDVLILGVTEATPLGAFKKIINITETSGDLILSTSDATLEEAINEGTFNGSFEIGPYDVDSVNFADGVSFGRTDGRTENSFPININTSLSANAQLSGSLSFKPVIDFNLELSGSSVEEVSIEASVETISQLSLSATVSGSITADKVIARYYLKPIFIKFLVFFPRMTVSINGKGEINVGLEAMAQRNVKVTGKLAYGQNGWEPSTDILENYTVQPFTPTGNVNAEISLTPSIELLLFGVIGPSFNPEAWLKYDIDIQRDPCWLVEAGLRGNIGINLNRFSSTLSANTQNLEVRRQEIARSTVSCLDPGFLEGRIQDAVTGNPIGSVSISVKKDDEVIATGLSGTDGNYQLSVAEGEDYVVDFTKDGFLPVTRNGLTVVANGTTFIEATLQIDEQYSGLGNIGGRITNALTGNGEAGVTMDIRSGLGNLSSEIIQSGTTETGGFYEFTDLEAGNYTVELSKTGFINSFFSIVVIGQQTTGSQNSTIAPESNGVIRIVLTWGASPSDLDSHLTGPSANGGRFHLYFNAKNPPGSNAILDVDDVSSFGPETITISEPGSGVYRYSVHDYSNRFSATSVGLANSQAKVSVLSDEGITNFFVPTSSGNLWTVFEISDGQIVPINSMSVVSNPSTVNRSSTDTDAGIILVATAKTTKN